MDYTMPVTKEMAYARSTIRASTKDSHIICKKVSRWQFEKAKAFIAGLAAETADIDGKHYTGAAEKIMVMLNSLEANARRKGLEPEKMIIYMSAHQGPNMMRSRRKRMFGSKMKITHVHAILKAKKNEGKTDN